MAALIDPLASGLVGCAGGTVTIYQRGTTTPATVYTGYDETGPTSGTLGVHSLDANGAKVIYTVEPLTIICKNNAGATVRTIVYQGHAGNVEVKQAGYNGAASTNVKEVLSDFRDSLGASDGQILVGGTPDSLMDAINAVASARFNVKSYGAIGNGVADDTLAIQGAINAGIATGSAYEIYLPDGNYIITAALTMTGTCTLRGAGVVFSSITLFVAGAPNCITAAGSLRMEDIFVTHPSGSGHAIGASGNLDLTLKNTRLAAAGTGSIINAGTHKLTVDADRSTFFLSGAGYMARTTNDTFGGSKFVATNCRLQSFDTPADDLISVSGDVTLIGCALFSGQTTGTRYLITANWFSQRITLLGNSFSATGGTAYILRLDTDGAALSHFLIGPNHVTNCVWHEALASVAPGVSPSNFTRVIPGIDSALKHYDVAGTALTLLGNFGRHLIVHSSGASIAITADSTARHVGRRITVTYTNDTGGSRTPVFGATFSVGTIPAVPNGSSITIDFVMTNKNKWQQVGGNPVPTA